MASSPAQLKNSSDKLLLELIEFAQKSAHDKDTDFDVFEFRAKANDPDSEVAAPCDHATAICEHNTTASHDHTALRECEREWDRKVDKTQDSIDTLLFAHYVHRYPCVSLIFCSLPPFFRHLSPLPRSADHRKSTVQRWHGR